jgi:hypothetical protein
MWYPLALSDISAFHLVISSSATDIACLKGFSGIETQQSLAYYTAAIRSVNNRLSDPNQCTDDSIIISLLGFLCYDVNTDVHNTADRLVYGTAF